LPQIGWTFEPLPLPLPLPLPWPPLPQSCGQLLISVAEHVPSPHLAADVPPASGWLPGSEAPPQLQATANNNAPATAQTIPELLLIMEGIVL